MNVIPKNRDERKLNKRLKKEARQKRLIEKWENTYTVFNARMLFYAPCVYFLKSNGCVVYIGETKSLMTRIAQHVNDGLKKFDSFSFEIFHGSDMERKAYEAELISGIKPVYNVLHNQGTKVA